MKSGLASAIVLANAVTEFSFGCSLTRPIDLNAAANLRKELRTDEARSSPQLPALFAMAANVETETRPHSTTAKPVGADGEAGDRPARRR